MCFKNKIYFKYLTLVYNLRYINFAESCCFNGGNNSYYQCWLDFLKRAPGSKQQVCF